MSFGLRLGLFSGSRYEEVVIDAGGESPGTSVPGAEACLAPGTTGVVIGGPLKPPSIQGLCEILHLLLEGADGRAVVCDLGALGYPDAGTVDALARLQLTARRQGHQIRLRHASRELQELLDLMGLCDVLPLCEA
jgi:ABC-type transporter Mla MlaB component